jgi:GT2 family glycosyltransferase
MRTRLKLKIRDKCLNFPKTYRVLRASYHGWQTFIAIYSVPVVKPKSSLDLRVKAKKAFANLVPLKVEPRLTVLSREFANKTVTLDIIVPVFNRGDLAARLFNTLQEQIKTVDKQISVNLICADDCSQSKTSILLEDLCRKFGFTYIRREHNLGFIGNVNSAWSMGNSEFVLLLNSDVTVTEGFLERVLDPLIHDQKVGLSTNPTFGMFATQMHSGTNLNALNSFLFETSKNQVTFVDSCTAVGYSLVVRRAAIESTYLLDPEFGLGYGEDSDLHYRVVSNGYRSVWNLDSAVSHEGSASFNLIDSVGEDRASGKKKFLQKWGVRYFVEIDAYNLALEESVDYRISAATPEDHVNTWVVVPTVKGNIGGIRVGSHLAIQKSEQDLYTRLIALDNSEANVIGDYISVGRTSQLFERKVSGTVVLVGAQSLELLRDEDWLNSDLNFVYFCQGPDWLIDPSTLSLFKEFLPRMSEVLSVSEFIDSEVSKFSPGLKITRYVSDIGYAAYSGLSVAKKSVDFLFMHRDEHGKLGWLAIALANFLSATHSVFMISGSSNRPYGLSKRVKFANNLDRTAVLKQFAVSSVYVDTSIFEGFGLTSREAALQNTKVLFMDVEDGRNELKEFTSHFSTLALSASIFELAQKAVNVFETPPCSGCDYCSN